MRPAVNDNRPAFLPILDLAAPGQALSIRQPHRRFGRTYAEFVRHAGDGKHVVVRKLISSLHRARWTGPLKVERTAVINVYPHRARGVA